MSKDFNLYTYEDETYITNKDMSEEEVAELANIFGEIYGEDKKPCIDLSKLDNKFEAIVELEEMLNMKKEELISAGILKKTNIGHLADILEGQEYIECLYQLMVLYIEINGFKRAINIGEEILRLDREYFPHLHAIVVTLYAYFEDDNKVNKICKKCDKPCIIYFISMMIMYYKKGNFSKAKEYLELVERVNSCFIPYFKGKKVKGEEGEIINGLVKDFDYLFNSAPFIKDFIINKGNI